MVRQYRRLSGPELQQALGASGGQRGLAVLPSTGLQSQTQLSDSQRHLTHVSSNVILQAACLVFTHLCLLCCETFPEIQ